MDITSVVSRTKWVSVIFFILMPFKELVFGAPGDLDLTFGGTGKVITDFGGREAYGSSVTIQGDGKILIAGTSYDYATKGSFAMARYNSDGSMDTTFNGSGTVITQVDVSDQANALTVQTDGKIVVAGYSTDTNGKDNFAVVRYNANGSLDTNFNGTGKVISSIGTSYDSAYALVVQADGKILLAGSSSVDAINPADIALVRYNANGSLDSTFNGTGKLTTAVGSIQDYAFSMVMQPDGKIIVGGYYFTAPTTGHADYVLVRYNSNGSLDTTFNSTGKVTTDISGANDYGARIVLQADGKILAAGTSNAGGGPVSDFALLRYNSNGSLDTTFNGTGKVVTNISGRDEASGIALQSDGKILVSGATYDYNTNGPNNDDFAVVRYNADGTLDSGFGIGGKVTTAIGFGDESGGSVAVQGDGKIVVSGYANIEGKNVFSLVRYQGDFDLVTFTPTLTAPAGGSVSTNTLSVSFYLPEETLPGSVKLTFTGAVTRVLTMATANESKGNHAFICNVSNPLSNANIVSGLPIPDGTYTVVLSYQDALGNPTAYSIPALNVTVNIDSDGDGIFDRYETGTGIYVSPTNTGTSSINPDSDSDGLNDGKEINYNSNPNVADTDGDGFSDGFEVSTGFNPASAISTPDSLSSIRTAVEYRFNAALGVSYRIEASADLATWIAIEPIIIGDGGVITRFYSLEGQPKRFFRSRRN